MTQSSGPNGSDGSRLGRAPHFERIDWAALSDEDSVRQLVLSSVPLGSDPQVAERFAEDTGLDYSPTEDALLMASGPAPSQDSDFEAVWLLRFTFNNGGQLESLIVTRSYAAP
jgi:hypothetical protein